MSRKKVADSLFLSSKKSFAIPALTENPSRLYCLFRRKSPGLALSDKGQLEGRQLVPLRFQLSGDVDGPTKGVAHQQLREAAAAAAEADVGAEAVQPAQRQPRLVGVELPGVEVQR